MKEFKHKVTGIVGEVKDEHWLHFERYSGNMCSQECISMDLVEGSEDWEEVVEKDYEILSFKKQRSEEWEEIVIYMKDGRSKKHPIFTEEQYLSYPEYWNIHSVKRLSDGEVFTVGDWVKCHNGPQNGNIKRFQLSGNTVDVYYSIGYDQIKHVVKRKKPLFTTEDGVELYEGDQYWWVADDNASTSEKWRAVTNDECITATDDMHFSYGVHVFSNRGSAEEYILLNKPVELSIIEITPLVRACNENIITTHVDLDRLTEKLKELVKSKL